KGLQIAGTRREILAIYRVERGVVVAEAAEARPLRPDVGDFEQDAAAQFLLEAGLPLLNVWRLGVRIEPVVGRESEAGGGGEAVFGGQDGSNAIGLIALRADAVE